MVLSFKFNGKPSWWLIILLLVVNCLVTFGVMAFGWYLITLGFGWTFSWWVPLGLFVIHLAFSSANSKD